METRGEKLTIGVLGGMGAMASADFYQHWVRIAQHEFAATHDKDFPPLFLYNLSMRDFDETGIVDATSVIEQLIAGVRKLEDAGADFFVIPCNTVHRFSEEMVAAVSIPLLSIIDVVAEQVIAMGHRKVGILSSQTTRNEGLYEQALSAQGVTVLHTTEDEQGRINAIIGHVMAGTQGERDAKTLETIIARFKEEGAESIVLGCTELPLAISQTEPSIPLHNSTETLARASLIRALGRPSISETQVPRQPAPAVSTSAEKTGMFQDGVTCREP